MNRFAYVFQGLAGARSVTMLLVEALLLLLLAARRDVRAAKGFQHYESCEKCVDAGLVRGLFPPLNLLFAVTGPY